MERKSIFGTHEWSTKTYNFLTGCKSDCKDCYAKASSIRFKHTTADTWKNETVRPKDLTKRIPKHEGMVMFPSSHDITPEHLSESITMINNILKSGNSILIVSKPNMECISKICETFTDYKDKILFRFTIGSTDSSELSFWEPNAPSFEERFECLKWCHQNGFSTSVSCEPLIQKNVKVLIDTLSPYVTETIWIGKPNLLLNRVKMNGHDDPVTIQKCNEWLEWINDADFIRELYFKYKDNPMIKFKASFRREFEKL